MAGLIPFCFFYAYFARDIIKVKWQKSLSVITIVVWIAIAFYYPPKSYWKTKMASLGDTSRWSEYRQTLHSLNGYGKVKAVMGLKPNGDHSLQKSINGKFLSHSWQVYANGPFSIAPLTKYWVNKYGGLKGLSCDLRNNYPLASVPADQYVLDYCEKEVLLRILK